MIRRERNGGRAALVAAAPRRRPSPPSDATSASLPFRISSARSVLTGRRLGVASQRHAPRRRGYSAWPPAGQHGARGGSGTRRLVLRLACALLHPLESMENDRMERGREMIGLSYRSSTREGRACRGRTPSASVPPSDATSASLPFRISFVSPRAPC